MILNHYFHDERVLGLLEEYLSNPEEEVFGIRYILYVRHELSEWNGTGQLYPILEYFVGAPFHMAFNFESGRVHVLFTLYPRRKRNLDPDDIGPIPMLFPSTYLQKLAKLGEYQQFIKEQEQLLIQECPIRRYENDWREYRFSEREEVLRKQMQDPLEDEPDYEEMERAKEDKENESSSSENEEREDEEEEDNEEEEKDSHGVYASRLHDHRMGSDVEDDDHYNEEEEQEEQVIHRMCDDFRARNSIHS